MNPILNGILCVAFDYNGTLVDDVKIGLDSANHMLRLYGVPEITLEHFRDTFVMPWQDFYAANGAPIQDIAKHQEEYQRVQSGHHQTRLRLAANAKAVLESLAFQDKTLAVLSQRNSTDLRLELTGLGVASFFDAIIGKESVLTEGTTPHKSTDALLEWLDSLHIKPAEVMYVGDMVEDVRMARRHGFVSVAVTYGWQPEERLRAEKPDYVIASLSELI